MGAVFKAIHPTLNKTVIIKRLTLTGNQDFIERFRREAQLMMEFSNEKIVQVYDHFKEGDAYHIVMEYVDGITLEDLITSRRFISQEAALLLFSEICKALKYAHDHKVIHRDIKPANILISKSGKVKLVDFGVSASLDAGDEDGLTKPGMTIGTPAYLAPEQIANAKNRDKRSDIYSLGVLLYEMVIGKKPFRGGFSPEVITMIEKGKYLPPRKINPKIKPAIERIIKKAMHHKVQKRFQDLNVVIAKTSRLIKHFKSQEAITSALRLYVEGNEDPFIQKRGWLGSFWGKVVLVILCFLILLCSIGLTLLWGIRHGYHYEWLYPERYGALQLSVKIRKGTKSLNATYIDAMLYEETDTTLNQLNDIYFRFNVVRALETNTYYTLQSQKVYLPQHLYKIVLYVENEQYRENFFLSPRTIQKKILSNADAQKIVFSVDQEMPALPVRFVCSVFAIDSQVPITDQTEISVLVNAEWVKLNDFTDKSKGGVGFVSGRRYQLQFKHPDFVAKNYFLTIPYEQTKVTMKIQLVPVPGVLVVASDLKDIRLLINDSDHFLDGRSERFITKLPKLSITPQRIFLAPGEYDLTAISGQLLLGATNAKEKVTIHARDEIKITIRKASNNVLQFDLE